jgi:transcriptional antiterminator RfaH
MSGVMRWICVRLELQRERVAKHFLQLAGYAVYIPLVRERVIRRHRRIERVVPLFPAYGFVGLADTQGWYGARWSIGVAAILMGGDSPAAVPDTVLDAIRRREVNGAVELPKNGFKIGDQVRVRAARTAFSDTCCRAWRSCPGSCDLPSTLASAPVRARRRSRAPA